jgi:hypothetical protein
MFIERLTLTNFCCVGPDPRSIDLALGLTAFVGVNGAGKNGCHAGVARAAWCDGRATPTATAGFRYGSVRCEEILVVERLRERRLGEAE